MKIQKLLFNTLSSDLEIYGSGLPNKDVLLAESATSTGRFKVREREKSAAVAASRRQLRRKKARVVS
jgi:hypothetical protein